MSAPLYRQQVQRLVWVLSAVAAESLLRNEGRHDDQPHLARLSVVIDLTFLPIADRLKAALRP
jgi:hypothetical protein